MGSKISPNSSYTVGYLGPAGTFTQQAAAVLCPGFEALPFSYIEEVFEAVAEGTCQKGVVPLENSTEGAVNATLDALLEQEGIVITALLMLPIRHCLLGRNRKNIAQILGHPQALSQCRKYIRKHFPGAEPLACASSGDAAARAAKEAGCAAIGPAAASLAHNLDILAENIQDQSLNRTAFIQIEPGAGEGAMLGERTSIAFVTENRPGTLYQILGIFQEKGLNLTKILSRPLPENPGSYIFYTDMEGGTPLITQQALRQVQKESLQYKFLGSYPVYVNT